MAGRLIIAEMDTLETWIGAGGKTFTLLYKISRDGCDIATFHQKCDGQGPTVTVLYNTNDTTFGGYTSVNWSNPTQYKYLPDNTAFLFRLQYNGDANKQTKFPVKVDNPHAVQCYSGYGPLFGNGHDLVTITGTIPNVGGQFELDGETNFGTAYDTQGLTADDFSNDNFVATDLEVYQVAAGVRPKPASMRTVGGVTQAPWRKTPTWDDQSSFVNTIQSVFKDRITQIGLCGSVEHSVTTAYRQYQIRCQSGAPVNVCLCDTRGLEEAQGIDALELNYLLDVNVSDWYQVCIFSSHEQILPRHSH